MGIGMFASNGTLQPNPAWYRHVFCQKRYNRKVAQIKCASTTKYTNLIQYGSPQMGLNRVPIYITVKYPTTRLNETVTRLLAYIVRT